MPRIVDDWVTGVLLIAAILLVGLGYAYGPWLARTVYRSLTN